MRDHFLSLCLSKFLSHKVIVFKCFQTSFVIVFQCHRLPMLSFCCPNVIVSQCCPASPVPTSSSSNAAKLMSSSPNAAQLLLFQRHRLPMLPSFSCLNVIVSQASPVPMSSSFNAAKLLLSQCHRLPKLPSFSCPNVIVSQCC